MKPIQLFVPTFRIDECLAEVRECLEKGWTGLGFKTTAFEDAWKAYTGLPHAHFLNSATAGLHLAVRLLKERHGWSDGDEIISTPLTFVSSNHAILYERLRPVFADVDEYLVPGSGVGGVAHHAADARRDLRRLRRQHRTARRDHHALSRARLEADSRRRAHVGHTIARPPCRCRRRRQRVQLSRREEPADRRRRHDLFSGRRQSTLRCGTGRGLASTRTRSRARRATAPTSGTTRSSTSASSTTATRSWPGIGLVSLKYLDADNALSPPARGMVRRGAGRRARIRAGAGGAGLRVGHAISIRCWSIAATRSWWRSTRPDLSRRALSRQRAVCDVRRSAAVPARPDGERARDLAADAPAARRGGCRARLRRTESGHATP